VSAPATTKPELVRADQIKAGDTLDLEGDSYADPNGDGTTTMGHYEAFEFEVAVVNEVTVEGPTCIRLCTSLGEYGFPPDHMLKRESAAPKAVNVGYTVTDYGYDVNVYSEAGLPIETYNAGNSRWDSQAYVEKGDPARLTKNTLRRFAKQTAGEMAEAHGLTADTVFEEENSN
jgi:hypothetical protein